MYTHCPKCLISRTGDVIGEPCRTGGCGGTIERTPEFSELVDAQPERFTCGRRIKQGRDVAGQGIFPDRNGSNIDYWNKFKSNGDRVCSYCGSLHPDDFLAMVKASAEAGPDAAYKAAAEIEPSDKGYKIYVNRTGVRNAHEGGIKFYTQHLPRNAEGNIDLPQERHDEYALAVKNSNARFRRRMNEQMGHGAAALGVAGN